MTTGTHAPEAHAAQAAQSTRWRLDPTRSAVEFRAKNLWGMAFVKGSFSRYHGSLDVSAPPAIELTVEADTSTRGTGGGTDTCALPSSSASKPTRTSRSSLTV
jgi:polyisoprenoid-binding protein YceI